MALYPCYLAQPPANQFEIPIQSHELTPQISLLQSWDFVTAAPPPPNHGFRPSPPNPLLIFTPSVAASHGYIVVAPQFYDWIPISGTTEISYAAKVTDWLSEGLQPLLPDNVKADLLKLALSGHSRGGKTAFALALGHAKTKLKFSVLLGIDPVAGSSKNSRIFPHILTYVPHSFNLSIPVTVIGTGLGPEKANCCSPACAPDGVNHKEFYNECKEPCSYFVAKDYGHMDMLDDNPPGIVGELSGCMCKNGIYPRDLMRRTVGGLVVAVLKASLKSEDGDFKAIVNDPALAPAKLDPVEFVAA
ncbi:Chlorophyllase [Quillaja saponaria]|uniref:Chlorophyllase n=1 Tax=Quillaja saponaria TaxID=32244 RepID=A0AAD7Q0R4_QUISA|nr:Chlorophyllase [Quillaja saponaria]